MSNAYRNTNLVGNSLDVLKGIPDGIVSCVMTSPPYWALRKYKTPPLIWGGKLGCKHEWDEVEPVRKATPGDLPTKDSIYGRSTRGNTELRPGETSGFCSRCGAWKGHLGLEPNPELYIHHLCDIFDQVKRVLRDDGTCWVNISDSYGGSGGAGGDWDHGARAAEEKWRQTGYDVPQKSCVLIPERFCIEMVRRGWILRQKIPWAKLAPMPSSVTDRFTNSWEPVYFFVKNNKLLWAVNEHTRAIQFDSPPGLKGIENTDWEYRPCNKCDGTGVKMKTCPGCKGRGRTILQPCEPCKGTGDVPDGSCEKCKGSGKVAESLWTSFDYWFEQQFKPPKDPKAKGHPIGGTRKVMTGGYCNNTYSGNYYDASALLGANMRDVWVINTSKTREGHFATYPVELCYVPISAGCPKQICKKCGLPRVPIIGVEGRLNASWHDHANDLEQGAGQNNHTRGENYQNIKKRHLGYTECGCNAGWVPGVVLDPFMGTGTTAIAAQKLGRDYLGIELSDEYASIIDKRLKRQVNTRLGAFA